MLVTDYLQSLKSLWGLGVAATVIGPLALWVPNLQPPWPEGSQMITAVFCIVVAMLSFSLSRELSERRSRAPSRSSPGSRLTKILGSIALVLGLACGVGYLSAFNEYVISDIQQVGSEARELRIVIGTELRDELRGTVQEPLQLLRDNGYDPERVWKRGSLLRTRFLVFIFFVGMFLLITFGMGLLAPVSGVKRLTPDPSASSVG